MSILSLFEGYGIELEYMIVDRDSLAILPISDQIMKAVAGKIVSDFVDGDITWSNELVLHVLEFKTSGPAASLNKLENSFLRSLDRLNGALKSHNARLMPTAMHPLMNPLKEMRLWPHDNNEIYDSYNRIFDCKGHGWSNLTSMHINYPFRSDEDFERLHTAIRFLLPILPALTASSPVVEGQLTGHLDNRLLYYQQNQRKLPSITGLVVPEFAKSMDEYHSTILGRIYEDIAPFDPNELMREDWLNSRGAIARFERQTIEIRVLDLQETPSIDLAIADFITATLKRLTLGQAVGRDTQRKFTTESLKLIFDRCVDHAESAALENPDYLRAWGVSSDVKSVSQLWNWIFVNAGVNSLMSPVHAETIKKLLKSGSLARRIQKSLGENPTSDKIISVYSQLCDCLDQDRMFEVI